MLEMLENIHPVLPNIALAAGLVLLAVLADIIIRKLLRLITRIALKQTESLNYFFHGLGHL